MTTTHVNVLYRLPMALRWRDLDAFNHVNNASFLTYLRPCPLPDAIRKAVKA